MKITISILTAICILTLGIVFMGCEVDSAHSTSENEIIITPASASIRKGEAVEFTASGWHEYTWTLQNTTWGTLSRRTGDRTVYTRLTSTNGTQVLRVSAIIPGTNAAETVSSEALILHE